MTAWIENRHPGLSPRMRGNPPPVHARPLSLGSIPAHAGEPPESIPCYPPFGVYPRACGGTSAHHGRRLLTPGLSPRMRGNHSVKMFAHLRTGSIPAHAGEPNRVKTTTYTHLGLSPRMRGNPTYPPVDPADLGSIPAHAGEPLLRRWPAGFPGVYPRACGGTPGPGRPGRARQGLSPRMRGNRPGLRSSRSRSRSIPAHAGEPSTSPSSSAIRRVYPRACGGTFDR